MSGDCQLVNGYRNLETTHRTCILSGVKIFAHPPFLSGAKNRNTVRCSYLIGLNQIHGKIDDYTICGEYMETRKSVGWATKPGSGPDNRPLTWPRAKLLRESFPGRVSRSPGELEVADRLY